MVDEEQIDFDPDVFAQRYADLLHEVDQLRDHRGELLEKYERLRADMQQITIHAKALESQVDSGTSSQIYLTTWGLVKRILKVSE